ncbi:NAD(P)/FAD-dependent oxidoreductase [Actinomadura xylanilytica]|uniref:NAD(P)/FAD-dependent oxidoreductase n=1 Tax=Actinomadura xylanilytica TaxID=887459 RepID=UPI00255B3737|nr:NAD(P)/FAD-dependent oxidoreductase [Actinomadura xylanilytica]MDL4777101.1 NAD(P)/FAD-dependent oxidoreductase [Actinomadura xylanilytica]
MSVPRIVIVGAGFAGYAVARRLERTLRPAAAEIVIVSPFGYTLYQPLLPEVAAGLLDPRSIAGPLHRKLRRTRLIPGTATDVDLAARRCEVTMIDGHTATVRYDRLVLCPGSVTRSFDIPGLKEHAHGMKSLADAVYLRDHVIAQLELANAGLDTAERAERLGFLVVGGGYSGVETAANLQLLTSKALRSFPRLDPALLTWTLIDVAPRLLPEMGDRLGAVAMRKLTRRGIGIRLGTTIERLTATSADLTDGSTLPCRTVVWTAGVQPSPVVATLDAPTERGRLVVGADLRLPGTPGVFAVGDAAAVPDLDKGGDAICPPTAQHATRQARTAARNVVASLHGGEPRPYRHRDLGMVVDLGGSQAVARPLGVPLTGVPAQAVTRGYHLATVPSARAKARVLGDWLLHNVAGDDLIRVGLMDPATGSLADVEHSL